MTRQALHRKGCGCLPCRKWWWLLKREDTVIAAHRTRYIATVKALGDYRVLFSIPKTPPKPFTQIQFRRGNENPHP